MYVFDPERLHEISKPYADQPITESAPKLAADLARAYPGHIETKPNWLFSLAGGVTGVMTILHGSLSEYLLIFGSPIGTEGFSGRYRIDIHDYVLSGEFWAYTENACVEKAVVRAGDHAILPRGQVKGFKFPDACWVLEYGRGPVPTSLPMALGDAVFSGMDGTTILRSLWIYGRLTARALLKGKI